jgi:signal transduction histidine kinase
LAELERANLRAVDRLGEIVDALKSAARPEDDARGVGEVGPRRPSRGTGMDAHPSARSDARTRDGSSHRRELSPPCGFRAKADLGEVVREVLALCAHELRHVRVEVTVPDDLPRVVVGHAELLQVVMNLVVNSAHALGSRGGRLEVRAAPGGGASSVVLSVADDGPGIDPSILPRLFRAGVTTRAAHGGTGLGLSIVKRIVDRHGGAIDVDSGPGRGARFHVSLPAALVAAR